MMTPASSTPPMQATSTSLNFMSKIEPARVPVHAPVPGSGMPTKISKAATRPRPAFASRARPAFSPLTTKNLQMPPISGLL